LTMSTPTYSYAAIFEYEVQAKSQASQCSFYATDDVRSAYRQRILAEMRDKVAAQALRQFTDGFASKEPGHWFNVGAINTEFGVGETRGDITFYTPLTWDFGINYNIKCKTTVQFQSDIKDPKAMASPQLEMVVIAIITSILELMAAHPLMFLILVTVIAVIIGAIWLQSAGGVSSLIGGPGVGGQIVTVLVVLGTLVAAVIIVPPLLKGKMPSLVKGRKKRR
jgi:hypothetical protein